MYVKYVCVTGQNTQSTHIRTSNPIYKNTLTMYKVWCFKLEMSYPQAFEGKDKMA